MNSFRPRCTVHLIIPHVVVDELDDLTHDVKPRIQLAPPFEGLTSCERTLRTRANAPSS